MKSQKSTTLAFCYASGQIGFAAKCPNGALPILRGKDKDVRDFVAGVARHGYNTREVRGRPTKVPGSECLLVPGLPEAPDQAAALDKLHAFIAWITPAARKKGLTVSGGVR